MSLTIDTFCGQDKSCKPAHPTVMEVQPLSLEKARPTFPKYDKNEVVPACMLNKLTQTKVCFFSCRYTFVIDIQINQLNQNFIIKFSSLA